MGTIKNAIRHINSYVSKPALSIIFNIILYQFYSLRRLRRHDLLAATCYTFIAAFIFKPELIEQLIVAKIPN